MNLKRAVISVMTAFFLVGVVACGDKCDANAVAATSGYLNNIIIRDFAKASEYCTDKTPFDNYQEASYKDKVAEQILSTITYELDEEKTDTDLDDNLGIVYYNLHIPNYEEALDSADNLESFVAELPNFDKTTISMGIKVKQNEDDTWLVTDPAADLSVFVDSIYSHEMLFAITGEEFFANSSVNDGEDLVDLNSLNAVFEVSDNYLDKLDAFDFTYAILYNSQVISEGTPDFDGDSLSCGIAARDVLNGFEYMSMGQYDFVIYNHGVEFYSTSSSVEISDDVVDSSSIAGRVFWQNVESCGMYFNVDTLSATMVIDSRFLSSGKDYDVTCNFFLGEEELATDVPCTTSAACVHSEYVASEKLDTGDYIVEFYNDGILVGSSEVHVIYNLNPDRYVQADIPAASQLRDANEGELLIYACSRNETDLIEDYSDVDFDYVVPSMNTFTHTVDAALASGENAPDIIICDSIYAARYANNEHIVPVNNVGITYDEMKYMYEYTFNMTLKDNVVMGIAWEITPGGLFYNRNLAQTYLGVSEPADVQPFFESWDAYLDTARLVSEQSNGRVRINASENDVITPYLNGRPQPWIENGAVESDDYVMGFYDLMNALVEEELTYGSTRWSSEWQARMSNSSVLSYFGTLEFGEIFLSSTRGTWGLVKGPVDYYDGGSFIFVTEYCDMPTSAATIIRDVTCNELNMENMASDGYTVNNINVMITCAKDDNNCARWLGGQNPYGVFANVSNSLTGKFITTEDAEINDLFLASVREYVGEETNLDSAYSTFVDSVDDLEGI